MAIEKIPITQVKDSPYQPRQSYSTNAIRDLASSIKQHGLLQVPLGRRVNDDVELACGHLRLRAYQKLAKQDDQYKEMPIDVQELTDEQMGLIALDENLKRDSISPMETARAIAAYMKRFPKVTETEMAKRLTMSQSNVANMIRVVRLPAKVLEAVDKGTINMTMARELCRFADIRAEKVEYDRVDGKETRKVVKVNPEDLMLECVQAFKGSYASVNATVNGMKAQMAYVAARYFQPIEGRAGYGRTEPRFDTAKCKECEHCMKVWPHGNAPAFYCLNADCWFKKDDEARRKYAEAARKEMRQQVVMAVAEKQKVGEIPASIALDESTLKLHDRLADQETSAERREKARQVPSATGLPATAPKKEREPDEVREMAAKAAGTRADVIDVTEYDKPYQRLDRMTLEMVDNPDECLKECTHGFHYAFSSARSRYDFSIDKPGEVIYVCTDGKCLARKKATATRKARAQGHARAKAERKAIEMAVNQCSAFGREQLIVLLRLMLTTPPGMRRYGYYGPGENSPDKTARKLICEAAGVTPPEIWGGHMGEKENEVVEGLQYVNMDKLAKLALRVMLVTQLADTVTEHYTINNTRNFEILGVPCVVDGNASVLEDQEGKEQTEQQGGEDDKKTPEVDTVGEAGNG